MLWPTTIWLKKISLTSFIQQSPNCNGGRSWQLLPREMISFEQWYLFTEICYYLNFFTLELGSRYCTTCHHNTLFVQSMGKVNKVGPMKEKFPGKEFHKTAAMTLTLDQEIWFYPRHWSMSQIGPKEKQICHDFSRRSDMNLKFNLES